MPTTKRLRLSIDFTIEIADAPPLEDALNAFDPAYHARQAALLDAVKHNPAVLERWLRVLVADKMSEHQDYEWHDLLAAGLPQNALAPALAMLSQDDQAYFREADRWFEDITDLFQASFAVAEEPPVIEEIDG